MKKALFQTVPYFSETLSRKFCKCHIIEKWLSIVSPDWKYVCISGPHAPVILPCTCIWFYRLVKGESSETVFLLSGGDNKIHVYREVSLYHTRGQSLAFNDLGIVMSILTVHGCKWFKSQNILIPLYFCWFAYK